MAQEHQSVFVDQTENNITNVVNNVTNIHVENFYSYQLSDNPYYKSDIIPEVLKKLIPIISDQRSFTIQIQSDKGLRLLDVLPIDIILNVKLKLQLIYEIYFNDQYLEFNGKILKNDVSLEGCNVTKSNNLLRLVYATKNSGKIMIFQRVYGRLFCLNVERDKSIKDVKMMIEEEEELAVKKQILFFDNGKKLKKKKKISDYEIKDEIIQLAAKDDRIKLSIRRNDRKVIHVEIGVLETIADLKYKIQDEVNIPCKQQFLNFRGNILENNRTFSSYSIPDKSMLTVGSTIDIDSIDFSFAKHQPHSTSSEIFISIRTSIGEIISIGSHSRKILIRKIKEEVEKSRGFLVEHQTLFLIDNELDDNKALSNYFTDKNKCRVEVILEVLLKFKKH